MYQRTRGRLLKLRSNFLLLLVVGAALLAAPAIVMALITDLGGNISPTIQSDKADIADPSANPHGNTSPALQGGGRTSPTRALTHCVHRRFRARRRTMRRARL